jgi:SAM-dependent methyltransferase
MPMAGPKDYVLGVNAGEIARLGLQHRVWRARALEIWRRGGLTGGMRALDFGCGPGWASLDLAEIVGPTGRVIAIDLAQDYVAHARALADARGLDWIEAREGDLAGGADLPSDMDFAWCRWVLAFTPDRARALQSIAACLKPGGVLAIQEYLDYRAWSLIPRAPEFTRFVAAVMASWRAQGGEPDIAAALPPLLDAAGFELVWFEPIVEITHPGDPLWAWPASFARGGAARLVELGALTAGEAEAHAAVFARAEAAGTGMLTPVTAHILARRRA